MIQYCNVQYVLGFCYCHRNVLPEVFIVGGIIHLLTQCRSPAPSSTLSPLPCSRPTAHPGTRFPRSCLQPLCISLLSSSPGVKLSAEEKHTHLLTGPLRVEERTSPGRLSAASQSAQLASCFLSTSEKKTLLFLAPVVPLSASPQLVIVLCISLSNRSRRESLCPPTEATSATVPGSCSPPDLLPAEALSLGATLAPSPPSRLLH